jgi:hypothetical protein
MTRLIDEIEKIQHAELVLADKREKWLRSRGWVSTSATPGSYWMWQKDWDGKTFLVDNDTATRIQEFWDREEDCKQHPDNYD